MEGKAIYSILTNDAPVAAIVGTRVYPLRIPQRSALPAITYMSFFTKPNDTKDGVSRLDEVMVQIDYYGESYSVVADLEAKARTALDRTSGTVAGVVIDSIRYLDSRNMFEDEARKVFRRSVDYRMRIKR